MSSRPRSSAITQSFQISTKLPSGIIAVIGGDSYDGFFSNLEALVGIEATEEIVGHFGQALTRGWEPPTQQEAVRNVQRTFQGSTQYGDDPEFAGTRQAAGPPPGGNPNAPMCPHGSKVWKTGVGQSGKAWKAWMCPAPKGAPDQCPPQWVR